VPAVAAAVKSVEAGEPNNWTIVTFDFLNYQLMKTTTRATPVAISKANCYDTDILCYPPPIQCC
jgi:hypothetical protein